MIGGRDRLIVCCAHGSAFDPAAGGRVEQVPAEVPLAAVALAWDPGTDRLFAEGVVGPDGFERFFGSFRGKSRALGGGPGAGRPIARVLGGGGAMLSGGGIG